MAVSGYVPIFNCVLKTDSKVKLYAVLQGQQMDREHTEETDPDQIQRCLCPSQFLCCTLYLTLILTMLSNECSIVQYQWAWIIVDYSTTEQNTWILIYFTHIQNTYWYFSHFSTGNVPSFNSRTLVTLTQETQTDQIPQILQVNLNQKLILSLRLCYSSMQTSRTTLKCNNYDVTSANIATS